MRSTTRITSFFSFTAIAVGLIGAVSAEAAEGRLEVEVLGIKSDEGQIGCSLWAKGDGFPSKSKKALRSIFIKSKGKKATCVFESVSPGTYAVSVMHDEDKDGELDSNLVGRPKEPWGVSNDVPMERFGPPKYAPATFKYDGSRKTIKVKLQQ